MISTRHLARLGKLVCLVQLSRLNSLDLLNVPSSMLDADMDLTYSRQVSESYVTSPASPRVFQRLEEGLRIGPYVDNPFW